MAWVIVVPLCVVLAIGFIAHAWRLFLVLLGIAILAAPIWLVAKLF